MSISEKRKSQIAGISQNAIQSKSDRRKIAAEKSAPPLLLLGKSVQAYILQACAERMAPAMDLPWRNRGRRGTMGLMGAAYILVHRYLWGDMPLGV